MKGYAGQILHVNLTTGQIEVEKPDEKFYRKYIGGSSMGTYYVMKGMEKGVEALAPESVIVFSVGPITGAKISGASRHAVTGKSPMTGGIMASEGGGYWGPELKFAGYDAVVITGKAEKPSYLWINDGEVEIRDGNNIWGKTTKMAQDIIREELNDKRVRVAQTGTAGENLCNYANIVNELAHFNGRGGLGAVMGSKNLRALAVRGTKEVEWYDKEGVAAFAKETLNTIMNSEDLQYFRKHGTGCVVDENAEIGGLPTRNFTSGYFEGKDELTSDAWNESLIRPGTCRFCAQSCKRQIDPKKTDEIDSVYGGPEYETIAMVGSNLGISDKVAISKINEACAKYAFDTISFGATVSFLMECFEEGIISDKFTGGLKLNFGNAEAAVKLAELTGLGQGFGKTVAKGSAFIAKEIGEVSERYLITVKNKEFPAHMPKSKAALGLAYALVPFGSDHCSIEMDPAIGGLPLSYEMKAVGLENAEDIYELNLEKAKLFWRTQKAYSLVDTTSACLMVFGFGMANDLSKLVEAINVATGWQTNLYELMLAGERRLQLMRAFNVREGLGNDDDVLPVKMFEPLKGGVTDGKSLKKEAFYEARDLYYKMAGWTGDDGAPTEDRLISLNLEWVVEFLSKQMEEIG